MVIYFIGRATPVRGWPIVGRYACTIGLVLLCFFLRLALDDTMPYSPFLIFMPAIFIAGFFFDRGSSFLATLLGAALGLYYFTPPMGALGFGNTAAIISLGVFLLAGFTTAIIVEILHKSIHELIGANQRLAESERALQISEAQLQKSDAQKTLLLDDINHRIKNSLQSVMGLLEINARKAADPAAKQALDVAARQLAVLARVFDRLHLSQTGSTVLTDDFINGLCADLNQGIIGQRPIALRSKVVAETGIGIERAISVGLIINELVSNALKHAFPDQERGVILVRFDFSDEDTFCLEVRDNGKGLPAESEEGSGSRLVQSFAAQLGGEARWEGPPGTAVIISFPVQENFENPETGIISA